MHRRIDGYLADSSWLAYKSEDTWPTQDERREQAPWRILAALWLACEAQAEGD